MTKSLPDKWIRKAIYDALNDYIHTCDYNVSTPNLPDAYVLMSVQSNEVDKSVMCGYMWQSSILLDIVTRYDSTGNIGSRLYADTILDDVREYTKDLQLDDESGLEIIKIDMSFPDDLTSTYDTQIVYRKFIRLELLIN